MKKQIKHFSFRVNEELLRKFEHVAEYHDRSMNWMLLSLVRKCVAEYEEEHGKIPAPENQDK